MLLRKAIREVSVGEQVSMLSSDNGTARDIPLYCQHMGHRLITADTQSKPNYFVVERGI